MPFPLFSGLGPGAQSLIKKITDSKLPDSERIDNVKKTVREMTIQDWNVLVKAFDEWPFAPEVCPAQLFVKRNTQFNVAGSFDRGFNDRINQSVWRKFVSSSWNL